MSAAKKKQMKRKKKPRRYGKAAARRVGKALHESKRGKLRSGRSRRKVKNRQQAIAIGLSEARRQGAKLPPRGKKRRASKKRSGKKKRRKGKPR